MTSQYRHRRTSNPATPAPTLEPGEISVNTANRQIHLGDAASGTLGAPKALLAVRIFDTAAMYAIGDLVVQAGKGYRALVANGPGAFNATQWELSGAQLIISATPPAAGIGDGTLWWDSTAGQLYVRYNDGNTTQWVIAVPQASTDQFVAKTGDTMTGDLTIDKANPQFNLVAAAGNNEVGIYGWKGSTRRWKIILGTPDAETGGDTGSDFVLNARTDAGAYKHEVLRASRATGVVDLIKAPTVLGKVWAAPFDALAYNGMQVNGDAIISQEMGTTGRTTAGYICDGWTSSFTTAGSGAVIMSQGLGQTFPGFGSWVNVAVTAAQASMVTTDRVAVAAIIEGYRVARLAWGTANAQPITIGFWTAHHRTGTYTGVVKNQAPDRAYGFTYTQNVADTWEYKTVTVPGDTTGTWNKNNTTGMVIYFTMAMGPTYTLPAAGVWTAGNYLAAPGQINGIAATSDVFRITGLVVLPGLEAPSAERALLIMRPYDQELLTCQRYWEKLHATISMAQALSPTQIYAPIKFSLKRAVPTIITSVTLTGFKVYTGGGVTQNVTAQNGAYISSETSALMDYTVAGGLTTYMATSLVANDPSYIAIDARL